MTIPVFTIFVVDDEKTIRKSIAMALGDQYQIRTFETAEDALEALPDDVPDLILLDIGLPGMSGLVALERIRKDHPEILVIMITAYEDVKTVIASMKQGVFDYIVKPLHMAGLKTAIEKALGTIRLRKEVQILQQQFMEANLPVIVGESRAVEDMLTYVKKVARSPVTPVMILGETGTGKELIARAIHYRSPNFQGPFVTVNCAAIPKDLIESELFGYTQGAFSGARSSGKKGLIEAAAKGTLFLDEVGDLSMEAQAKLLRFLEEGTFYKLGGTRQIAVNTRVLSATNRDLERMIGEGTFRKDLFFRLGVVKIEVPSLSERREDILPLANYFLHQFGQQFDKPVRRLSRDAEEALLQYSWSGNIRELKNLIECGVIAAAETTVTARDLGIDNLYRGEMLETMADAQRFAPLPPVGIDLPNLQQSMERFYIREALKLARGNESQAARLLNLNHHTFRYRRRKLEA